MAETITEDGEILTTGSAPALLDHAMAGTLVKAEIDSQVATAKQFPRSIKVAIDNITTLATMDEETAIECIYALKRGGKPIRGPSIRMAEIIQTQWCNNRCGAQVVAIDRVNKLITSEGFFHDLETNTATKATVQRRISDAKGRIFSDDMIAVTGNAANSIAKRNAILGGVPKLVWRKGVEAAEQIIRGDAKTLVERRDTAIKAFAHFNLSPDQIFAIMEVKGEDDIGLDDLVTMRGIYSSLKNGEATVEELLRGVRGAAPQRIGGNPLADEKKPEAQNSAASKPGSERQAEAAGQGAPASTGAGAPDTGGKTQAEWDAEAALANATARDTATESTPAKKAFDAGRLARINKATRKALPPEFREEERKAEADAWLAGYDQAAAEK